MIRRNTLSLLLVISIVLCPLCARGEEPEREDFSPVSACLLSEAEKLNGMEAGVDYVEHEAVFSAEDATKWLA